MSHVIIGTAGHIDHGKTALVKALTGTDTDRLKEEKERGLTIDLGFAPYGEDASIIDVPGHEKFIRNMVAGVSTIDFVILVVAADDGIMPQTREHLDILNVLQVKDGLIAITKIDLVEPDWLQLVVEEARELVQGTFLREAPIFPVSSVTGEGLEQLQEAIDRKLKTVQRRQETGLFWQPVDRSFVMKGFGTVVTGSVLSGTAHVGETLVLLPAGKIVKIRGLQRHGKPVQKVAAGDRAAINLQGIDKHQVRRGDVLATPGYFQPTSRVDVRVTLLESAPRALKSRTRVRFHVGTSEVMARLAVVGRSQIRPGETAYAQMRLEETVAVRRSDAFVIRQYSPTVTIGGGAVLDANPPRHKFAAPETLAIFRALENEKPETLLEEKLLAAGLHGLTLERLSAELGIPGNDCADILNSLVADNRVREIKMKGRAVFLHASHFQRLAQEIEQVVRQFHREHPLKQGVRKSDLPGRLAQKTAVEMLDAVLSELKHQGTLRESSGVLALKDHGVRLTGKQKQLKEKVTTCLFEEGFSTSAPEALAQKIQVELPELQEILQLLLESREVVRLEGLYFHARRIAEAHEKVVDYFARHEELTIGAFKDLLAGTSRKYAMPILNHFDALGVTERAGDVRIPGTRLR